MDDIAGFLAMGGYGQFVWPAYGVAAIILVGLLVASIVRLRREERVLEALTASTPGRARRRGGVGTDATRAGP